VGISDYFGEILFPSQSSFLILFQYIFLSLSTEVPFVFFLTWIYFFISNKASDDRFVTDKSLRRVSNVYNEMRAWRSRWPPLPLPCQTLSLTNRCRATAHAVMLLPKHFNELTWPHVSRHVVSCLRCCRHDYGTCEYTCICIFIRVYMIIEYIYRKLCVFLKNISEHFRGLRNQTKYIISS